MFIVGLRTRSVPCSQCCLCLWIVNVMRLLMDLTEKREGHIIRNRNSLPLFRDIGSSPVFLYVVLCGVLGLFSCCCCFRYVSVSHVDCVPVLSILSCPFGVLTVI